MPPFFTRGILIDAPTFRGVDCLPKGSSIDAAETEAICRAQGVTVEPWDVVVFRTGYMGLWPDAERMAAHKTAGPDISTARWMLERGVIVRPVAGYGMPNFLRVSIGLPAENQRFLDALAEVLRG